MVFSFVFMMLSVNSFAALDVALSDQGTGARNKSTGQLLSQADLTIEVYDALTGGNLVYSETFTNGIANGSWNVMIGETSSLPLEYGKVYYRDYRINGEDASFTNGTGGSVGRQFFYSPLGDINGSKLINSSVPIEKLELCSEGQILKTVSGVWVCSTDTVWNIATSNYMINQSGILYVNESRLNATIDARDTLNQLSCSNNQVAKWNSTSSAWECESDETSSADLSDYALKNQSETFAGNITTTQTGFFGWLGTLVSRITKLFVVNIDASGNINASNYTLNGTTIDDWSDIQTTDTNTHVAGDGTYLYNDSATVHFNETKLNATIDARQTTDGQGLNASTTKYLYDDGAVVGLNETELNATVDSIASLYNETSWVLSQGYLVNDSSARFSSLFVDTNLIYADNGSIGFKTSTVGSGFDFDFNGNVRIQGDLDVVGNFTQLSVQNLLINGSILPEQDAMFDIGNSTRRFRNGSFSGSFYVGSDVIVDGQSVCLEDGTNCLITTDNDTTYSHLSNFTDDLGNRGYTSLSNFTNDKDFINSTQAQAFNESAGIEALNISKLDAANQRYNDSAKIDAVNTTSNIKGLGFNTTAELDNKYIAQNEESNLNVNSSAWWNSVSGWVASWFYVASDNVSLALNETKLNESIDARTAGLDTQKGTSGKYLYNDSANIMLNETELNDTIDARDDDTHAAGDGIYLYNDSATMYLNETKLNATINALENDTLAGLSCSANQVAKWNGTVWLCANQTADTQKSAAGIYLYNDSTSIHLNETKLNSTIESLDNDTLYYAGGVYIYNNGSNWFYFNETKLNESIDAKADGTGGWTNSSTETNTSLNVNVGGNITPSSNNTYSLGAPGLLWKELHVGPGSIHLGSMQLYDRNGCLATRHFTAIGDGSSYSGYIKLLDGPIPTNEYEANASIIYSNNQTTGFHRSIHSQGNLTIDGKLGIGVNNPQSKLEVRENGTGGDGQLFITGSTDNTRQLRIGYDTTDNYGFIRAIEVGAAERNLILQEYGGRVGIGTDSPSHELNIIGDTNATGTYYGSVSRINELYVDTNLIYADNGTIGFKTSTVGSGYDFDFNGNVRIQGDLDVVGNFTSLSVQNLLINGSLLPEQDAMFDIGNSTRRFRNGSFSGSIDVGTDVIVNGQSVCLEDGTNCILTGGDDVYLHNVSDTLHFNETKLNLTIDERVPINSTDLLYLSLNTTTKTISLNETKLNNTIDDRQKWERNETGNYTYLANSQDSVGIGVRNPQSKLEIRENSTGGDGQLFITGSTDNTRQLRVGYDTTDNYGFIRVIEVGAAERNLILQEYGGRVGIGTDSPSHKLNVVGDANITGNLTLGEKITFSLGEIIDNIADGWLRITGNLNVTGNLSAGDGFDFVTDDNTLRLSNATDGYGGFRYNDGSSKLQFSHDNGTSWGNVGSGGLSLGFVNSTETLEADTSYDIDTSSASFNVTLPDSPDDGTQIRLIDVKGNFGANSLLVLAGGSDTIEGSNSTNLSTANAVTNFFYDTTNTRWTVQDDGERGAQAAEYLLMVDANSGSMSTNEELDFVTVDASSGSSISYDTGTDRFTLAAGKTYKLTGQVNLDAAGTFVFTFQWRDMTNSVDLGEEMYIRSDTPNTRSTSPIATAYITTTTSTEVALVCKQNCGSVANTGSDGNWGLAEVIADGTKVAQFTGATSSSNGTIGFIPAPQAGQQGNVLLGNGSWDSAIFVNGSNVGIGTTSPGQKLTVVGDANITGNLTVSTGLNYVSDDNTLRLSNATAGYGGFRYNDGSSKLQFSHDNGTTWSNVGSGGNYTGSGGSFYGGLRWDTTPNCQWSGTTSAGGIANYSADAECDDEARTAYGLTTSNTASGNSEGQLPQIKFNSMPSGYYRIVATGMFSATSSGDYHCAWRFATDGGLATQFSGVNNQNELVPNIEGLLHVPSDLGATTIQVQFSAGWTTSACEIDVNDETVDANQDFEIDVYYFPSFGTAKNDTVFSDLDGDTRINVDGNGNDSDNITFFTAGTQRAIITNDGNIGIGTTSPSHELNVVGDANITGTLISDTINEVSSQGLVFSSNFNFNSVDGSTVYDSSGENNHGTVTDATYNSTGGFNNGGMFSFDGDNDWISIADDDTLDITGAITLSSWVYFDVGSNDHGIISKCTANCGSDGGFDFRTTNAATPLLFFNRANAATSDAKTSTGSVSLNEWHHVAVTVDDNDAYTFYIDGEASGNGTFTGAGASPAANSADVRLGNRGDSAIDLDGRMDEARIYNRALSQDEILALYHQRDEREDAYVSQKDVYVDSDGYVAIGMTPILESEFGVTGQSVFIDGTWSDPHAGTAYAIKAVGSGGAGAIAATGSVCGDDADLSNCASDARLKENVSDYEYGLDEILKLRPVTFNWNELGAEKVGSDQGAIQVGMIAQEVEQIIPQWVETNEDGYKHIPGEGEIKYALVKAVQELKAENDALKVTLCDMGREEWC